MYYWVFSSKEPALYAVYVDIMYTFYEFEFEFFMDWLISLPTIYMLASQFTTLPVKQMITPLLVR